MMKFSSWALTGDLLLSILLGHAHGDTETDISLLHRMQANHISFRIYYEHNKPVLPNRHFFFMNLVSSILGFYSLNPAIKATKVNNYTVGTHRKTRHSY